MHSGRTATGKCSLCGSSAVCLSSVYGHRYARRIYDSRYHYGGNLCYNAFHLKVRQKEGRQIKYNSKAESNDSALILVILFCKLFNRFLGRLNFLQGLFKARLCFIYKVFCMLDYCGYRRKNAAYRYHRVTEVQ